MVITVVNIFFGFFSIFQDKFSNFLRIAKFILKKNYKPIFTPKYFTPEVLDNVMKNTENLKSDADFESTKTGERLLNHIYKTFKGLHKIV